MFKLYAIQILSLAIFAITTCSAGLAGGFSEEKSVEEGSQINEIVQSIKDDFLTTSGWESVPEFRAISYRSQVVAGTNYIVKVKVEDGNYAHLRIFVPLPHSKEPAQLTGYQLNKKLADELALFDATFSPSGRQLVGSVEEQSQHATDAVKALVAKVRPDFDSSYGSNTPDFEAISFKKQTVKGINYFIKVRIDGDKYVHLRVHQPLPNQGDPTLVGIQYEKKLADSIEYFSPNIPTRSHGNSASTPACSSLAIVTVGLFVSARYF